MAITVKHTKVSTIADGANTDLVRPSDWNADHTLTGLGTAAELNAGVANGEQGLPCPSRRARSWPLLLGQVQPSRRRQRTVRVAHR